MNVYNTLLKLVKKVMRFPGEQSFWDVGPGIKKEKNSLMDWGCLACGWPAIATTLISAVMFQKCCQTCQKRGVGEDLLTFLLNE